MANNNESGTGGIDETTRVVEAAKEEVKKEVEAANNSSNPDQEKRRLGERIREELERAKLAAQEAVNDEVEARISKRELHKKEEGKKALRALTKAVEAVRQGIDPSYIAKTKEGAVVLQKIAEEKADFTPSVASAVTYYFGDYLFGDKKLVYPSSGKINEEVLKKFSELKQVNPIAAEKIAQAIEKAATEMGISPDEVREKLRVETPSMSHPSSRISSQEEREQQKIFREINEKAVQALKDQKLSFEELSAINHFLLTGEKLAKFDEAVEKIGVSSQTIEKYRKITQQINQEMLDFGMIVESYAQAWVKYVDEAKKEFSIENLQKYFRRDKSGKIILSREDRQFIKERIRRYLYLGLSTIHENHSEPFHKLMGEHQDVSYYIMMIRQVVKDSFDKIIKLIPDTPENSDLIYFLTDASGAYVSRIYSQAEVFHDAPLLARDLGTTEKILDFLRYLFPSQLAELFDDDRMFMTIARDEMAMLLRKYLVDRDNQYDGSLLSGQYQKEGVFWQEWFKKEYRERLKERLRRLAQGNEKELEYLEENEWKIEMVATYAEAIGVMTLLDGEVLATSDPVSHFRNVHPLMSLLSAKHNWLTGRGRSGPGLINKYLLGMEVEMYPKKRSLLKRLFFKKGFDPEAIKKEIDSLVEVQGARIFDNIFNASGLYYQLLSMFNLPNSFNSWDGWRIQKIPQEFIALVNLALEKKINKEDGKLLTAEDWQNIFDFGFNLHGTSFLWWSIKGEVSRLTFEIDNRLKALGFYDAQIEEIKSKNAVKNLIEITFNGQRRKLNYLEFEELKLSQRRGELYFRYLRRNPGDFLMILNQVCPEVFSLPGDPKKHDLLFKYGPDISKEALRRQLEKDGVREIDVFIKKHRTFWERWKGSFEELRRIHQWYNRIAASGNKDFLDADGKFSKKKFIDYFYDASATAYARMKKANEPIAQEIKEIFNSNFSLVEKRQKIEPLVKKMRAYLTKEDFFGFEEMWEIFAGKDGFFEAMTGLAFNDADKYFNKFGGVNGEGEMNIFFNIAHNWFLNNGDINPFAADVPYYELFRTIGFAGEDMIKRTFEANLTTYKQVVSQLGKLEVLLWNASQSGSLGEIMKIHQSIYDTLSGLVSQEYAWRANYILAQIVANFFAEHSVLRDPKWAWLGPVGWLARLVVGKNTSLSKLLTKNRHAFSMDSNGLRTYFEMLRKDHLINPELNGPWGMEQLNRVFETSMPEFIFGDVAPKVVWSIILFMLLVYIKKAIEEAEGKKK